jgi:DMSO/TMAO reductase YedYZ molybdopterin-dependent catalytic subunit
MNKEEKIVTGKYIRNRTILAFGVFTIFILCSILAWKWLQNQPREEGALRPLRKALDANEIVFGNLYSTGNLSKVYPVTKAAPRVRVNGDAGMSENFDTAAWRLKLARSAGDTLLITMDEIKKLPKTDVIFDFKCIEGWSQVTHWAGVRFSEFAKHYNLTDQTRALYTGLVTPDQGYYVGIDTKSMMHDQTILCYEMNGKPLPMNQGFPLRLIIPVKYGVKHLKRIGTMYFSNTRPKDYWYERGYDYYCGL